jgi:lysophospholipase L1-like esterase
MKGQSTGTARKNLLLFCGALFFSLVVAEVVVRVVDPVRPLDRVEFVVDRETYWKVKPNQFDLGPPPFTVNAQGFRGTRDVGEKQPGRSRVFLLGDSYTWGWGVGDDETYAAELERLGGGRLDVINGGTSGWGVFQFQARLRQWIDELDPDVVVVLVNTGDILRQPYPTREEEEAFLRRSALRNAVRDFSKLVTVTVRLLDRIRQWNRPVANAVAMDPAGRVPDNVYQSLLTRDVQRLAQMVERTRQHGARFVLVAWPQRIPSTPPFLSALAAFAREHDVTYLDLSSTLEPYELEEYSLPDDPHPSAFGHRLIAERIYAII